MGAIVLGRLGWRARRDREGYRTYDIDWLVQVDDVYNDGPQVASGATGLPLVGSSWVVGNEADPGCVCTPESEVSTFNSDPEPQEFYTVTQQFTNKPRKDDEQQVDNPLLQPAEVSGSFISYQFEAFQDKDGNGLLSSSHERFVGPAVERDGSRPQVVVNVNVATLPLGTYAQAINTVNITGMWGLSARMVKFSEFTWRKVFHGPDFATFYYEITMTFDINFQTFDRIILDEGTRVLKPGGTASNPKDYIPYTVDGQPAPVLLNGSGAAITNVASAFYYQKRLYTETNLLLLPVPPTL